MKLCKKCDALAEEIDVLNMTIEAMDMTTVYEAPPGMVFVPDSPTYKAATDMYEALERILAAEDATQYGVNNDNRDDRYSELAKALMSARAALKKARGEA